MTENPLSLVVQALIAMAIIAAVVYLAVLDPASRPQVQGALTLGVGSVIGFFFSQRATASGTHAATNGMSTIAGLVASATPGPSGPVGPSGPTGPAGHPGPVGPRAAG